MIIGITGGTGCGKTTLLSLIEEHGGKVIDCDRLYHKLLKTDKVLLENIENRFPTVVENGVLQRKKLGNLVFSDPVSLQDLNRITHQRVYEAVVAQLTSAEHLTAIDAIGLFESGLNKLCKLTVAVTAPTEARINRLMARDGIGRDYAHSRISAQPTDGEFSARCDYTLVNDGTGEAFREKCLAFLQNLAIITM